MLADQTNDLHKAVFLIYVLAMGHKECVLVQHDVFCAFKHEFLAHLVAVFGPYICNGVDLPSPHSPVGRAGGCYI